MSQKPHIKPNIGADSRSDSARALFKKALTLTDFPEGMSGQEVVWERLPEESRLYWLAMAAEMEK